MAGNSESSKERKVQCYGLWEKGVENVGHGGTQSMVVGHKRWC